MQPKIAPESSSSEKPAGINKRQRARGLLDYTLYNPRTSTHGCGRTEMFVSPYILCAAAREDETPYLTWLLRGDSLGSKQPVDIPKFQSLAPMVEAIHFRILEHVHTAGAAQSCSCHRTSSALLPGRTKRSISRGCCSETRWEASNLWTFQNFGAWRQWSAALRSETTFRLYVLYNNI